MPEIWKCAPFNFSSLVEIAPQTKHHAHRPIQGNGKTWNETDSKLENMEWNAEDGIIRIGINLMGK